MKSILTVTAALLTILATSCGPELVPFTTDLEFETGLTKAQLKHVQFFTSNTIILYREVNNNTTQVIKGDIKMMNGKQVEQIVIPPNTPGVVIDGNDNRLGVSFEKGSDRYLVFGKNPLHSNAYTPLAKDWKNNVGTVQYGGKPFKINSESAASFLIVNTKRLHDFKGTIPNGQRAVCR